MAFVFKKAAPPVAATSTPAVAGKPAAPAAPKYSTQKTEAPTPAENQPAGSMAPAAKKTGFTFLKTGAARKEMMKVEEARSQARQEERGKLWRYWQPVGEVRQVTFLDGALGDDGLIDAPAWYEHDIQVGNVRDQFACTFDEEGWCPLCQRPQCGNYAIHALTIVEHTPHEIQKGPNRGQVIQHRRKLYTPKMTTLKTLTGLAVKHGGLTGLTIDIGRSAEDAARVGDTFEIINVAGSYEGALAYMKKTFGVENTLDEETGAHRFDLPDYAYEIGYKSADELVAMNLGEAPKGPGYGAKKVDKAKLANAM